MHYGNNTLTPGVLQDPQDVITSLALKTEFIFSCQVTMPPYVIVWEKDGVELEEYVQYQEVSTRGKPCA